MTKRKITVLTDGGMNSDYAAFIAKRFDVTFVTYNQILYGDANTPDLLLFTGGADITPAIYGENINSRTMSDRSRDGGDFKNFIEFNYLPKVGICRGSQMLTVASRGKLIQHVTGHLGYHTITTKDGEYDITSTHHQMLFPFNLEKEDYEIIAYSKEFKSDTYLDGDNKEIVVPEGFVEPEIVKYHKTNSLAIQGHPEMRSCPNKTTEYCLDLIEKLLN